MTAADMAALHRRCFETPRPWTASEFEALLAETTVFAYLLPAGFALGRAMAHEAELLTLAVDPAHRRAGLGTELLAGFETEARRRAVRECFLEVSVDNGPACALYRACGYAEAGRRRNYYRRPDGTRCDAIVLRRSL